MSLQAALAGIRRTESGSFKGNYGYRGQRGRGGTPEGAYGILDTNWVRWTVEAGIPGANKRSSAAQDRVAAYQMQKFYDRYGSWEVAAAAFFGGTKSADIIVRRGGVIGNAKIAKFVKSVSGAMRSPDAQKMIVSIGGAERQAAEKRTSAKGWIFPVAGANEWSRGSYMAKHTKGNRSHYATDIYAKAGTPIVAPVSGKVLRVTTDKGIGGNTIQILGDDGVTYYFAHLNKRSSYEKGQRVMAGRQIGATGTSGNVPGKAQVHFTMKKGGKPVDPRDFLAGAESVGGLYADLKFEDPVAPGTGTPGATDPVAASYGQQQPFGSDLVDQMIDKVSSQVAGGSRLDPREWIDPELKTLDLEQTDEVL